MHKITSILAPREQNTDSSNMKPYGSSGFSMSIGSLRRLKCYSDKTLWHFVM